MRTIVKLGLDGISGPTRTIPCGIFFVLGKWISALDHKPRNHPVKDRTVVKPGLGQLDEAFDVFWGFVWKEREFNGTEFGVDNRLWLCCFGCFGVDCQPDQDE